MFDPLSVGFQISNPDMSLLLPPLYLMMMMLNIVPANYHTSHTLLPRVVLRFNPVQIQHHHLSDNFLQKQHSVAEFRYPPRVFSSLIARRITLPIYKHYLAERSVLSTHRMIVWIEYLTRPICTLLWYLLAVLKQ